MSSRNTLRSFFQTGDKPTAAEFSDLIDSLAHVDEDGLATQAWTTTQVTNAINAVIGGAPGALNTLDELAAALADDSSFATTITNALAGKQNTLVSGTTIRTVNGQSLLGAGDIAVSGLSGIGTLSASQVIGWTDTLLVRDAANVVAQRNGTNAQAFRLYNTFTDGSNYERAFMRWASNRLEIGCESAGTGTQRSLRLIPKGGSIDWLDIDGGSYSTILSAPFAIQFATAIGVTVGVSGGAASTLTNAAMLFGARSTANSVLGFAQGRDFEVGAIPTLTMRGMDAHSASVTHIAGGSVTIESGAGASASAGAAHGGNLILRGGLGYGTGTHGRVIMDRLPTSAAGLPTGAIWNDSGTLKIA